MDPFQIRNTVDLIEMRRLFVETLFRRAKDPWVRAGTRLDAFANSKFGSAGLKVDMPGRSVIPAVSIEDVRVGLELLLDRADELGLSIVAIHITMAIDALAERANSAGSQDPKGPQ